MVSHNVCQLQLSAKHVVLFSFFICVVKRRKKNPLGPALTVCQFFEGRRKTVKSQCYSYMIVCINTSRARPCPLWAAFEHRLTAVCWEREVCLLLWQIENGSWFFLFFYGCSSKHRSALYCCGGPNVATLDLCPGPRLCVKAAAGRASGFRTVRRAADGQTPTAAAAQDRPASVPLLDKLLCGTPPLVVSPSPPPDYDPVFLSVALHPAPPPPPPPLWLLVRGISTRPPGLLKPTL